LILLAAISINALFKAKIIDTAVNGAVNYADAQNKEQITFEELDRDIQDIVNKIKDYDGSENKEDNSLNHAPIVRDVIVERVNNSISELTITATVEDEDGDSLTYILLRGDTADNITETELEPTSISGNTVTFTDTGLTVAKMYYYKVKVLDESESGISANYGSERTHCLGSHCSGERYTYPTCGVCSGNKIVTCTRCSGTGKSKCSGCKGTGNITCVSCSGTGGGTCGYMMSKSAMTSDYAYIVSCIIC